MVEISRFTRFFLLFFLSLSIIAGETLSAESYVWGNAPQDQNWAFGIDGSTGGLIENSENSGVLGLFDNGVYTAQESDSLTILETVKIKGDIEIAFPGNAGQETEEFFDITIGSGLDNTNSLNHVTIQAFSDENSDENSHAQLVFNPGYNKTITVNILNSLFFKGADKVGETGHSVPLYITFRGAGSTVFRLPGGRTVSFGPENSTYNGAQVLSDAGVNIHILMDQSGTEAITERRNQVTFERYSYGDPLDLEEAQTEEDAKIIIGQHSSLTFLSKNSAGVSESWSDFDNDSVIDPGETVIPGYGTLAFDPSNIGSGRLILEIDRGQGSLESGNDFTDGAFNLCGHLITGNSSGVIENKHIRTLYNETGERVGVSYNKRAGVTAIMRLIDTVAYNGSIYGPFEGEEGYDAQALAAQKTAWAQRGVGDRRGLLVINKNNSIARFANNYDRAAHKGESKWAISNSTQPGFIIGNNGELEISHNLFLDYIAAGVNRSITSAHGDITSTHGPDNVKKHNPAALVIDGYATYQKKSTGQLDAHGLQIWDDRYLGTDAAYGFHAQITVRGHGGLFARAVPLDNQDGAALSETNKQGLFLGIGRYDGVRVMVPEIATGLESQMLTDDLDGAHAIDIEGNLTIKAVPGPDGESPDGFLTIPSVRINHAGQETTFKDFYNDDFSPVLVGPRVLTPEEYYPVYNRSSILFNSTVGIFDTTIIHSDVTRDHGPGILPSPFKQARPVFIGGEMPILRGDIFPSVIHMHNSEIHCQESLVISGVGIAIHELRGKTGYDADNLSYITFYNRGRELDGPNGHGTVLQLGSQANLMADGITGHEYLHDAHIIVYRSRPTEGLEENQASTIKLTLETAPAVVNNAYTDDQAIQVIYLANDSYIGLGWPTEEADYEYAPWTFDDAILARLKYYDPRNIQKFRFVPYSSGDGELHIAGDKFYIGAGDELDDAAPIHPIPGGDVGGVLYVDHGGLLSIADGKDLFVDTVIAHKVSKTVGAGGVIKLPDDQVHFSPNGHVQPYPVDFVSGAENTGKYQGYVLLGQNVEAVNVGQQVVTQTDDYIPTK